MALNYDIYVCMRSSRFRISFSPPPLPHPPPAKTSDPKNHRRKKKKFYQRRLSLYLSLCQAWKTPENENRQSGTTTSATMSLSYSKCFPDLLCSEDSGEVLSAGESPEFSSDFGSPSSFEEESIAGFIVDERSSFPAGTSHSLSSSSDFLDSSSRSHSVAWILKVSDRPILMSL